MPSWGLTAEQRSSEPWGIPAALLAPGKTITDPVHGDIYLTVLERAVLDTSPMQRLRRVRQLGMTHLVYPGATHSRFSHALGTLRAAQDLLDVVTGQRDSMRLSPEQVPKAGKDIFARWRDEGMAPFNRKVAEATVLVRVGALLHDLGHVSFGHSIEDELGILEAHDENTARYVHLWQAMLSEIALPGAREVLSGELAEAIRPLIVSKEKGADGHPIPFDQLPEAARRYPFAADIVGNTICADLLDYLRRDHLYSGLPAQFGRRFLQGFYVPPADHQYFPGRMVIRIAKEGRQRADVISELFKFLRYRYELSERALTHHAKLAADAMVGKLLEMWYDSIWIKEAMKRLDPRPERNPADRDSAEALIEQLPNGPEVAGEIEAAVKRRLENYFLSSGDDGLLERIRDNHQQRKTKLQRGLHELSSDLLKRALFKQIGVCSTARASAGAIYQAHRKPKDRKALERAAAKCADLADGWKVVVWIPPPEMRLKAAEVLVDDGNMIAPLVDYDETRGHRGAEIYASHKALWGVSVYVHPSVLADKDAETKDVILAFLAERLGIAWDQQPEVASLTQLAVRRVVRSSRLPPEAERRLLDRIETEKVEIAAKGGPSALLDPGESFKALVEAVSLLVPPD